MTGRFLDDDDTLDPDEIDELLDDDATIFGEDITILAPPYFRPAVPGSAAGVTGRPLNRPVQELDGAIRTVAYC